MRIFRYIFWGICLAMFSTCVMVPAKSKKAFLQNGFCYDHITTNASDGKFNINGYYGKQIFYNDGMWVGGYDKNWTYPDNRHSDKYINGIYHWGLYKVFGDTIKIRYIQTNQYPNDGGEMWKLIVDSTTLAHLVTKDNLPITKYDLELSQRKSYYGLHIDTLVPYDSLPEMNRSWFKKSKWLWCDKAAYETWKASQIQKGEW